MKSSYWMAMGAALSGLVAFANPKAARNADSPCYASDSYSDDQIAELRTIVAGPDSTSNRWRQIVHLPAVAPSAVALVSESASCASALTTFNSATQYDNGPAVKLYLFSVGNVYVGANPHFPSGESVQHVVMDSTFAFLGNYLK